MRSRLRRPSPALVVAAVALFVALGGPAEASRLINGKLIKRSTISSKQIKNHSLSRSDFSSSAVKSLRYTPKNSITPSKIRRNAVGASELRSSSVSSMNVVDNSLLAQDLSTGSVGADEIIDGTIGSNDLGNNIVSVGKLKSGAVRTSEVADGTLRAVDLGSFAGTVSGAAVPALTAAGTATACASLPSGSLSALSGAQDVRDDVVLVGRPGGLPATLDVAGQPDPTSTNVVDVIVCNRGGTPFAGGTFSFPFVTINP